MNLQEQLQAACEDFARRVLAICGRATLLDVASTEPADLRKEVTPQRRQHMSQIGLLPMQCPVPGCTERGVRRKKNFCMAHDAALPAEEKVRLRAVQRSASAQAKARLQTQQHLDVLAARRAAQAEQESAP